MGDAPTSGMLTKDRATLRNVVLTALVATSGALLAGTTCLGRSRSVTPTASVTATDNSRPSSVGGSGAALAPAPVTLTNAEVSTPVQTANVEGSSASGAPTDAPRREPAPQAVQVRGRPIVATPATAPLEQQPSPPPQQAPPVVAQPVPIPVPANGVAPAMQNVQPVPAGTFAPVTATQTNGTVPAVPVPSASTPGYGVPQPGAQQPAIGTPQVPVPGSTAPVSPGATAPTPPPAGGFQQGMSPPAGATPPGAPPR